jgi:hypothetical protein
MAISGTDLLASIALVVSIASAFFAKRAADAATAANRLSLHQPRAEIFGATFDYRALFVDMDLHPNDEEMQEFYRRAILPSHLYLPARMTDRMHKIYVRSRELYASIEACESGRSTESKWTHINELQNIGKTELDQLIRDLATDLDVGDT